MDKAPKLRKLADNVKVTPYKEEGYDNRPLLRVSESQLPELTSWKVGDKYMMEIEVEMISARKEEYGSEKDKICAEFKVTKIGVDNDYDESEEGYKKGGVIKKAPKKK